LAVYTLWLGALCVAGLLSFYFWPTKVPPSTLYTSDFPGITMLRRVDAAGNACPSLHVAAAMFTAIRVEDVLRWARTPLKLRFLNVAWFAAIAYSTLAVKQHVVVDVLVGALFGVVFALPSMRWRPRRGVSRAAI
jgi:membrane-associated phospholipid phosphatase